MQLVAQVEEAVANGPTLVMGGKRIDRPGSFMQPTILTNVKPDNPAFRQEFFGPVALFFRVKNEDEAIELANDSDFGLGGSVFTRDIARGKRVASRIDTGMVFINHPTWTASDLPFGGIKNSGYGRELSRMGIQEFVVEKWKRCQEPIVKWPEGCFARLVPDSFFLARSCSCRERLILEREATTLRLSNMGDKSRCHGCSRR